MVKRNNNQNSLYHVYVTELWRRFRLLVYDGTFEELGYPNPIVIKCRSHSYNDFRGLLKLLDMNYPKTDKGLAISSTKLSREQMYNHMSWIQVLIDEDL
jgi:hypothetical protein